MKYRFKGLPVSLFGMKIEDYQLERGWTNAELARRLGLGSSNVFCLKRAKKPQIKTIHNLAKAFGCSVDEFREFL
jgi:transcriptional regulator with XRE-family HTH domain